MRHILSSDHTGLMKPKTAVRRPSRHCTLTTPTQPTRGNASVSVGPSKLLRKDGELGLFAATDIKRNTIVCSFQTISLTVRRSRKWLEQRGLEAFEDSGLHDRDRVLHDVSFTSVDTVPCWYRLNHSYYPNLCLVSWQHGEVEWMAEVDIKRGDELTFTYGRPDPAWLVNV